MSFNLSKLHIFLYITAHIKIYLRFILEIVNLPRIIAIFYRYPTGILKVALKRRGVFCENLFRIKASSFVRSLNAREKSRKLAGHSKLPMGSWSVLKFPRKRILLPLWSLIVLRFLVYRLRRSLFFIPSFLDKLEAFPINSVTYVRDDVENCVQFTHFGAKQV